MAQVTRRRFIQAASASAAALGALAAGSHFAGLHDAAATATVARHSSGAGGGSATRSSIAASEPLVAYVRDLSKGEIVLFVGTREIVRQDPELAARLHALT